jgi:hypothetical protein
MFNRKVRFADDDRLKGILRRQQTDLQKRRYDLNYPTQKVKKSDYIGDLYKDLDWSKIDEPEDKFKEMISLFESSFDGNLTFKDNLGEVMKYIKEKYNYYVEDPLLSSTITPKDKTVRFVKPKAGGKIYDLIEKDIQEKDKFNLDKYKKEYELIGSSNKEKELIANGLNNRMKIIYKNNPLVQYGLELQKQVALHNLFKNISDKGSNSYKKFEKDLMRQLSILKNIFHDQSSYMNKINDIEKRVKQSWNKILKELIEYLDVVYKAESYEELEEIEKELKKKERDYLVDFCKIKGKYTTMLDKLNKVTFTNQMKENKKLFDDAYELSKESKSREELGCGNGKEQKLTLEQFLLDKKFEKKK